MDDVTMTVTVSKEGNHLILSYAVTNNSDKDIYLKNVLPRRQTPGSDPVPDPNAVLIAFEGEVAHIAKTNVPPAPKDILRLPIDLKVTPLAAGRVYAETLRIALPLVPWTPFSDTFKIAPREPTRGIVKQVDFSLQYTEPSPGDTLAALPYPNGKWFLLTDADSEHITPESPMKNKILRSKPFSIELPYEIPYGKDANGNNPYW